MEPLTDRVDTPDNAYADKLSRMQGDTLLPLLDPATQQFVRQVAARYRFSFQELRLVAQAARDLSMWQQEPLEHWWLRNDDEQLDFSREHKKRMLALLRQHLTTLTQTPPSYSTDTPGTRPRRPQPVRPTEQPKRLIGLCPAYSPRTVCCGLHTLDAVVGCAFACSYCTIQTFYDNANEYPRDLAVRLREVVLDPKRFYHIGTGQSSDSLAWGNRGGLLDALCEFAAAHPNVLLELKTKSDNIRDLLRRNVPANVVCSWSLNTDAVIANEEHGTATLARRIDAARTAADHGIAVAFHFHPMVHHQGWQRSYGEVAKRLLARFSSDEIAFVSMGTVTLIRPVVQEIRRRGGQTKILQMQMVADPHGKLTYPDEIKIALYRHLLAALGPWRSQVFVYLCMERADIWDAVFGRCYEHNDAFADDFARHYRVWSGARQISKSGGQTG